MIRRQQQRGFSLIEVVLSIVILGIVVVVVGEILIQGYKLFTTSQNASKNDWQGLLVMQRFTKDVHNIRSANSVASIAASTLSFTDMGGTSVTYTQSGSNILRNGVILASGVTGMSFNFLDKTGTITAVASLVRFISISITLTENNLTQTYTTIVATRGMP